VPRRLTKKKTIGVRVPGHPVAHALLAELDQPMLSATLLLPGREVPFSEAGEIRASLEQELDLVIDGGSCGIEPSTVIDLTEETPRVLREGKGSLAPFAIERV
jgi:tRNA threonylcarbamoyl adenosine modification protein (Sua5/YciO/YrdC/YwlC family)